jgi:serine/threonine protein kinase/tetratricopeptide (TPR) repeat protein
MSAQDINPAEEISGNWARIKELFAEAIEIDPASRATWLQEKCRDNPVLAKELTSLLEHDHSGDRFLETPAWRIDESGFPNEAEERRPEVPPGTVIGSWRVLREISSGGMGTVYLAERTVDDEDRPVMQPAAIKIIQARVDAGLFAGRFRRERRILAQLNHPFIARFLEGGTLENDLPYFALDYVEGEPIDSYCRNRQLDLEEILQLFCKVCSAVAHAHRNLVVHRDLKPSNILVAADGTPRLLDFGIAKLLADEEETLNQTGALAPYTPRYCSPEQIRGEPVTTASDIFVLGIVLHQLVTGLHPFDPVSGSGEAAAFEILRCICEDEPRKAFKGGKRSAGRSGQLFHPPLKGDFESIVLKALRKAPTDRYKSVEYLMDDVQNFLARRPVLARPQSWWYRTRTLVKRHPTATLAGSTATVIGIIALVFIVVSDRSARRERNYAFQQRELAASSARTMINDLASSLESMSAPIERRLELLNRVAAVFDQIDATSRGELDPATSVVQVRAEVQTQLTLARALEELGDMPGAIHRAETGEFQARKLLDRRSFDPLDQLFLPEALLEKSRAFSRTGNMVAAAEILEGILTKLRQVENIGNLAAEPQTKLEVLLCDGLILKQRLSDAFAKPDASLQRLKEAVSYGERAYQTQTSSREALDCYASSLEELGRFYYDWGRFDLFAGPVRKALSLRRKAAEDAPGDMRLQRGSEKAFARWESSLALADPQEQWAAVPGESLSIQRKLCAADPNNVDLSEGLVRILDNDAIILADRRQYAEAKNLVNEAIAIGESLKERKKRTFDVDYLLYSGAFTLSVCCRMTGDLEAAKKVNLELLIPLNKVLNAVDSDTGDSRFIKALCWFAQADVASASGNWRDAERMYSEALPHLKENLRTRDYPYDRYSYGYCLARMGRAESEQGKIESGCQHIESALGILHSLRDGGRIQSRSTLLDDIADAEEALGRFQRKSKNSDSSLGMAEK